MFNQSYSSSFQRLQCFQRHIRHTPSTTAINRRRVPQIQCFNTLVASVAAANALSDFSPLGASHQSAAGSYLESAGSALLDLVQLVVVVVSVEVGADIVEVVAGWPQHWEPDVEGVVGTADALAGVVAEDTVEVEVAVVGPAAAALDLRRLLARLYRRGLEEAVTGRWRRIAVAPDAEARLLWQGRTPPIPSSVRGCREVAVQGGSRACERWRLGM